MDISIQRVKAKDSELWLVSAGSIQVHFKDQDSAIDFATKLKARVESPHELPTEAVERIAKEYALAIEDGVN
jgi:lactam utilization protein B